MTVNSSELTDFINAVKESIEKTQTQNSFELIKPIEFEISVIVKKEGRGGVNIAIVEAGGKYEKESVSKIKFSMGNPHSWEELEKMARTFGISSKTSNENIEIMLKAIQSQKN